MSTSNVLEVYRSVIDDVIKKVRPEFLQEGVDDVILTELRALWEDFLLRTGAVSGGEGEQYFASTVSGGPSTFSTELSAISFPDTSHTPSSGITDPSMYSAGSSTRFQPAPILNFASSPASTTTSTVPPITLPAPDELPPIGRPSTYMPPPGSRPRPPPPLLNEPKLPQFDGNGDDGEHDDEEGNLDDSELEDSEEEPSTDHMILCLFEKVARVRNKRKCNFKDGIIHIHGKDVLFNRATGEFDCFRAT